MIKIKDEPKENEILISSSSSPSFQHQYQQQYQHHQQAPSNNLRDISEMSSCRKSPIYSTPTSSSTLSNQHVGKNEWNNPNQKANEEKEAAAALLGLEITSRRKVSNVGEQEENRAPPVVKQEHNISRFDRTNSYREGEDDRMEERKHIHGTPESASYVSPVSTSSVVHEYGEMEERVPHFPTQLHEVLSSSELSGIALEWLPHGRSWRILRWEGLRRDFLARYFPQCGGTPDSFLWHVDSWGFKEIKRGPDRGSYFHALFLRDHVKLCHQMPWPISYVVQPRSPVKSPYMAHEEDYDDETYYYYRNKGISIPSIPGYPHHGPPRPRREDFREEAAYASSAVKPPLKYEAKYEQQGPPGPSNRQWKASPDDEYYLLLQRGPQPLHHDHHQNVFRHRHPKQPYPHARSSNPDETDSPWLSQYHQSNAPTTRFEKPFPVVTSESQSSTPERDHQPSLAGNASYAALTPPYHPANIPSRNSPVRMLPPDHPEADMHNSQFHNTPPSAIRSSTMPLYTSIYNQNTPPSSNTVSSLQSCRGGMRHRSPFVTTTQTTPQQQQPIKKKFTMSNRGGMKQVVPTTNNIDSPPSSRIAKVSPEDMHKSFKDFPVAVAISRKKKRKLESETA